MAPKLPMNINELTVEWLSAALAPADASIQVASFSSLNELHGTATKIHLALEYIPSESSPALPATCWIKGGFAEHSQMMASIYAIESRFYREIAPSLDILVPRCYFAEEDTERGQAIVILEDLKRPGVSLCTVHKTLNFTQAAANLDSLARLHARWWNSPALEKGGTFDWVKHQDPMPEGLEGVYQRGQLEPDTYARCMTLPRGTAVPRLFHDNQRMAEAMEALRLVDREGPHCLLHGDAHLGNLYLTDDGTPGFLDWQALAVGTWCHDVTYFIISALDIADRPKWEKALLMYYLERLRAYGADPVPDFESAWSSYVKHMVYGLFYWLVNPIEFQAEENNCAVASRFAMAALEHDTFSELGV